MALFLLIDLNSTAAADLMGKGQAVRVDVIMKYNVVAPIQDQRLGSLKGIGEDPDPLMIIGRLCSYLKGIGLDDDLSALPRKSTAADGQIPYGTSLVPIIFIPREQDAQGAVTVLHKDLATGL